MLTMRTLVAYGLLVGASVTASAQQPVAVAEPTIEPAVVAAESPVAEPPAAEAPTAGPSTLESVNARLAASLAELNDEEARLQAERRELAERMRAESLAELLSKNPQSAYRRTRLSTRPR